MNIALHSQKEAAELLNISVKELTLLVVYGKIDYTIIGKRKRFTDSHIQKYLDRNASYGTFNHSK